MGRRASDNPIDWEVIQRQFRLGQKSLRQLASEFGVQPSAISRRAKSEQWVQDKSAEVRALTESKLIQSNTPKATEKATPTRVDIEIAAQVAADVVIRHRGDALRGRNLVASLLQELEAQCGDPALFAQLGELMDESGEDANGKFRQDKRAELYGKVISMGGRVDNVKKLMETLAHIVKIEREAFGIAGSGDKEITGVEAMLKRLGTPE